jgi:hypothetical protein
LPLEIIQSERQCLDDTCPLFRLRLCAVKDIVQPERIARRAPERLGSAYEVGAGDPTASQVQCGSRCSVGPIDTEISRNHGVSRASFQDPVARMELPTMLRSLLALRQDPYANSFLPNSAEVGRPPTSRWRWFLKNPRGGIQPAVARFSFLRLSSRWRRWSASHFWQHLNGSRWVAIMHDAVSQSGFPQNGYDQL